MSAVLREMHHPYIDGYKPRVNFQESLRDAVLRHAPESVSVAEAALAVAANPASGTGPVTWDVITAAPAGRAGAARAPGRAPGDLTSSCWLRPETYWAVPSASA